MGLKFHYFCALHTDGRDKPNGYKKSEKPREGKLYASTESHTPFRDGMGM